MRKTYFKSLLIAAMCLTGGGSAFAQTDTYVDVTATYIKNADLSSLDGWSTSTTKASSFTGDRTCFSGREEHDGVSVSEAYAGWGALELTGFSLTQEITLSQGKYRLISQSFYRQGETTETTSHATLKAGDSNTTPVMSLNSESLTTTYTAYAGNTTTAAAAFKQGLYKNSIDFTIDANNTTIEVGITGTFDVARSWCIAGPFQLLQEGSAALAGVVAKANSALSDDAYTNVTGFERTALSTAITNNQSSTDYATAVANINTALTAFTAAKASYDAYATYIASSAYTTDKAILQALGVADVAAPTTAAEAAVHSNINLAEYNAIVSAGYIDLTSSFDASWTASGWDGAKTGEHWDGTSSTYYDIWNGEATTAKAIKSINLPAGSYVLKLAGRSNGADGAFTFSANGTTVSLPAKSATGLGINTSGAADFTSGDTYANSNNGRGWEWRFIPVTLTEQTDVTVTVTANLNNSWAGFCNFAILASKETAESFSAGTEDYAALKTAIENAETHTLGFEAGEYAPYKNVEAAKALAAAKAIDQTASNTKAAVTAATTALNNATWGTANTEEVNAVNNGDFSEATLSSASGDANAELQKFGWTAAEGLRLVFSKDSKTDWAANATLLGNSKAVFAWSNTVAEYGKTSGYTMPLKANTKYQLTVQFAGWGGAAKKCKASVLNSKSEGLAETNFGDVAKSTESITTFKKVFTTGEAGDYVLQLKAEGNYVIANISIVKAVPDDITLKGNASAAPTASEYANVTLERTFATGWNSVVLPFATTPKALGASEAAKYTGTNGTTINFSTIGEDGTLDANTPYLVYFTTAKENPTFEGVAVAPATSLTVADAAETQQYSFVGTYTAIASGSETIKAGDYIVVGDGIQKAKGGNALKAFRAYFQAQEGANKAKNMVISIDGNVVTGIDAVSTSEPAANASAPAYNLAGQRVGKSYKGVVIVNGKKVIRK